MNITTYYVTKDANSFEAISYTTNVIADAGAAFTKEGYKPLYNPAAPSILSILLVACHTFLYKLGSTFAPYRGCLFNPSTCVCL